MLDGVLIAANDWEKADAERKPDFLAHRGSRLADAQALAARGPDWARENAPAQAYLAACQEREKAEQGRRRRALAREQARLAEDHCGAGADRAPQRQARWTLPTLAAAVTAALGVGVWQYLGNMERARPYRGAGKDRARTGRAPTLRRPRPRTAKRKSIARRQRSRAGRQSSKSRGPRPRAARRRSSADRSACLPNSPRAGACRAIPDRLCACPSCRAFRLPSGPDKALVRWRVTAPSSVWQAQWRLQLGGHEALVPPPPSAPTAPVSSPRQRRDRAALGCGDGQEISVLRRHEGFCDPPRSAPTAPASSRVRATDRARLGRGDRAGNHGAARAR